MCVSHLGRGEVVAGGSRVRVAPLCVYAYVYVYVYVCVCEL